MKNKAQIQSIATFIIIVIAIFITSIIVLKVTGTFLDKLTPIANNLSLQAGNSSAYIKNSLNNTWDSAVMLTFFINVIILFVSAFLVDIHPVFIIVYIVGLVVLFVMALPMMDLVKEFYGSALLSTEATNMPITSFFVNNFGVVLLALVVITGIIMFAKFRNGGQNNGSY